MQIDSQRRIQRRELKDYQQLFMLMNSVDILDEGTRKDFICITGAVWKRYNEATKGASKRRITALFLSNDFNGFEELLFVGCDYERSRQHRCCTLWDDHTIGGWISQSCLTHVTTGLAGRTVLRLNAICPDNGVNRPLPPSGSAQQRTTPEALPA